MFKTGLYLNLTFYGDLKEQLAFNYALQIMKAALDQYQNNSDTKTEIKVFYG